MNLEDSPEKIEREIERTRADLSRTLNDLQQRLSPSSLMGQTLSSAAMGNALRSARSGTAEFAASLGRSMSHNPLPALLTGIGILWMMLSKKTAENGQERAEMAPYEPDLTPEPSEDFGEPMHREDPSRGPTYEQPLNETVHPGFSEEEADVGEFNSSEEDERSAGAGGSAPLDPRTDAEVTEQLKAAASKRATATGGRAAERARGAPASVSGRVGRISESVSQGVGRMTGAVRESSGAAYRTTKDVAQRATYAARQVPTRVGSVAQSTGSFVQENPIISGAIAVALGAALALMIPSSRRERRLIGETSDEVKSSVREAVEQKVERAKDVVRTAAEAAADAARKEARGESGEPGDTANEAAGEPAR